jgi:hypothetical protein
MREKVVNLILALGLGVVISMTAIALAASGSPGPSGIGGGWYGAWLSSPQAAAHRIHNEANHTWHFSCVTSNPLAFYWQISHGDPPDAAANYSSGYGSSDASSPAYPPISILLLGGGLLGLGFLRQRKPRNA